MKTALVLAAKRGVDVRIVTPAIPDKKIVFRLTRSYYEPLIKAGVKIYEYTPGFIHSKSFACDDRIGVVGTINMDYRSLYLHFECATLMCGSSAVMDLKKDCLETFEISKEIRHEDCRRNFFGLLFDAFLRIVISHDEVVHGKCSLINKMPGDYEAKFAMERNSRIMVCPKRTSGAKSDWQSRPYALFLQENERNEVRLERNSRIMVLFQICDLARQTLCCCTPRTE